VHLKKNSSIEKVDFLLLEKIEMHSGLLFLFFKKRSPNRISLLAILINFQAFL
jgi:hypothetical protein